MSIVRVIIMCVGAALICASLRAQRPEMALGISLAIGIAALLIPVETFETLLSSVRSLTALSVVDSETTAVVVKAAGITVLSELGVQVCDDAGERALSGKIRLVTRLTLLGMAMPMIVQIVDSLSALLSL